MLFRVFVVFLQPSRTCLVSSVSLFLIHGFRASSLKSNFKPSNPRTQSGRVTVGNFRPIFKKLKGFSELFTEDEIKDALAESHQNMDEEIDFESFLRGLDLNQAGETRTDSSECRPWG
ncbi:hypothetical protein GLYMA_18G184100v4 [Glycine max]|nr:hypothetical protein GLYMA_18G184100v4 [Glycine max]KAH1155057.1 hypothetical protein GYH30_050382 [Glycine max]